MDTERQHVHEILGDLSPELQDRLKREFARRHLPIERVLILDLTMALLAVNTPEATSVAQELAGCAIRRCPATVPPWPPKPVSVVYTGRCVVSVANPNPCHPGRDSFRRFGKVKIGMTKTKLRELGISARDLQQWTEKGWMELS